MYIIYKIGLAKLDKSLNEVLSVQQQHSETTIKLVVYDNGGTVLAKKKFIPVASMDVQFYQSMMISSTHKTIDFNPQFYILLKFGHVTRRNSFGGTKYKRNNAGAMLEIT